MARSITPRRSGEKTVTQCRNSQQETFSNVQPIQQVGSQQETFSNVTPINSTQPGMLSQAWDAIKSRAGSMAQHLSESPTAQSIYDVSAPGIATEYYKKFTGQPNTVDQLPKKLATTALPMMVGEPEAAIGDEAAAVKPAASAAHPAAAAGEAAEGSGSGVLSRAMDVAKRRVNHIPGVQAVKDIDYIVRGGAEDAPEPPPAPAPPSVPDNWGKGVYGTPVDQWGQRITQPAAPGQAGQIAESMQKPAPSADVSNGFKRGSLGDLLDQSLGAKKLEPNVPLRKQMPATSGAIASSVDAPSADLPAGHTPVKSSALTSYKYDPSAREFEAKATSGNTVYVYGDVDPEDVKSFESADSKGKAWQTIRQNPLVAKIVNGKRIAVKAGQ